MMQKGATLAWPTFARSAPILAEGERSARPRCRASLRPLLAEVSLVARCARCLLGLAAYLAFAVLPLGWSTAPSASSSSPMRS